MPYIPVFIRREMEIDKKFKEIYKTIDNLLIQLKNLNLKKNIANKYKR